jgi:type 1 fimbriae regulatory protein FimE
LSKPQLRLVLPKSATPKPKPPGRLSDREYGRRRYITPEESELLFKAANHGRCAKRDVVMLRMAYVHGLRCSELVALKWSQLDLKTGHIHVFRAKHGKESIHELQREEWNGLKRLPRPNAYVFNTMDGRPMTPRNFASIVQVAGKRAGFDYKVHPHMLRHGTGYRLANPGVDTRSIQLWLGHSNIAHTAWYSEVSPERLKGLWDKQ